MSPTDIKSLMLAHGGTPTERCIALLIASGITSTKDIAEALGVTLRAVQKAKQRTAVREPEFASEPQDANHSSTPNHSSPKSEPQFVSQPSETRAHATKELPSEVVIPRIESEVCAVVAFPSNPRALGTSPRQRGSNDELAVKFEQWWSIFPAGRKRAKGRCREVFIEIAARRHCRFKAAADEMIEAARVYAATRPDPKYVPMPLTWLNQGRWEDDPADSSTVARPSPNGVSYQPHYRSQTQIEAENEEIARRMFS